MKFLFNMNIFLGVLGWNRDKLANFDNDTNLLTEEDCTLYFRIQYQNLDDLFPNQNTFDLALYSNPRPTFQTLTPHCFSSKHAHFNYISDHYLKVNLNISIHFYFFLTLFHGYNSSYFFQNTEFSQVFKTSLMKLYTSSWIGLYFGYKGMTMNNSDVVIFANPNKQTPEENPIHNSRFTVSVEFPSTLSQIYFLPLEHWSLIPPSLNPKALVYQVDWISDVDHGMLTQGFPYTKSPYHRGPFFIHFKTNQGLDANLLTFNNYLIPNSYDLVLGLLNYNDDTDRFDISYPTDIKIPYDKCLALNNMLEFEIRDSDRKKVLFSDNSQLFISVEKL
jgi:hypothetical protein